MLNRPVFVYQPRQQSNLHLDGLTTEFTRQCGKENTSVHIRESSGPSNSKLLLRPRCQLLAKYLHVVADVDRQ